MAISMAQAQLVSDRRFFLAISIALAAASFIGFAPTYYLAALNDGPKPVITPAVHVHGALCTAWILLLVIQTGLIASGRRDIHRVLGMSGVIVIAATVVSGFLLAIDSDRRVHTMTTAGTLADPYVFLIFPLTTLTLFTGFALLGVLQRRRPDVHKRLMLLATASLIAPALARMSMHLQSALGVVWMPGVVGALVLLNLFLAALVVHDFSSRGRLHPVTLWGGGLILLSEPLRFVVGFSDPWQAFARALMT